MKLRTHCNLMAIVSGLVGGWALERDMVDLAQYAMQFGIFSLLFGVLNAKD